MNITVVSRKSRLHRMPLESALGVILFTGWFAIGVEVEFGRPGMYTTFDERVRMLYQVGNLLRSFIALGLLRVGVGQLRRIVVGPEEVSRAGDPPEAADGGADGSDESAGEA